MDHHDSIVQFMNDERAGLDSYESSYLAFVFEPVDRYYGYLRHAYSRFSDVSALHRQAMTRLHQFINTVEGGIRISTPEEQSLFELGRHLQEELTFEVESMALFGNILLDRVASTVPFYFGGNRPWGSFDAMNRYLRTFCDDKGLLKPPSEFVENIAWLRDNLCQFRHEFVAHKHETDWRIRQMFYAIHEYDSEEAKLQLSVWYPKKDEPTPNAKIVPSRMVESIDLLIDQWVAFLRANRASRRLAIPELVQ